MVPLRDENPIKITPYVTYGLIVLNVLMFLYEISLNGQGLASFFEQWAVIPRQLFLSLQLSPALAVSELATLVSAQFLHAGPLHLGGNMLYLWIFGNNLEEELGRVKFLLFYLLCGVLASLVQAVVEPTSTIPSLGASGAIAGVMGAYVFRFPQVRILTAVPIFLFYFLTFRIPAYLFLGFWFIQQAFYGIASLDAPAMVGMQSGGVAYWAHAGGFVWGALLAWMFGLFRQNATISE